ncbi:MAG: distal tail protein Dit [Ethanoligenens sp.]
MKWLYGFTFKGQNSLDFGLYLKSDNRQLLPDVSRQTVQIPGRAGTIDFGIDTYAEKQITVELTLPYMHNMEDLMQNTSKIAAWLYDDGQYYDLIFDDQPDRKYQAKVASKLDNSPDQYLTVLTTVFICNPPFAFLLSNLPTTPEDATARAEWNTMQLDDAGLQYIQTLSADGDMRLTVGGTLPVACTIKLIGYIPAGLTLTYSGQTWGYTQLLEYDGIRSDTDAETSWRMSDDANLFGSVDYPNGHDDYFILQPGQNTIHIAGVAGAWPYCVTVAIEFAPMEAA